MTSSFSTAVELKYTFTCHSDKGAVAILDDFGEQARVMPGNWTFPAYMLQNHASWQQFAYERFHVNLAAEDIVLVSGWIKTSKWELAVFDKHLRSQDIAIQESAASFVTGKLSLSSKDGAAMSSSHRSSAPLVEGSPVDKGCLFLWYFKLKRRGMLLTFSPEIVTTVSARDTNPYVRGIRTSSHSGVRFLPHHSSPESSNNP